MDDRPFTALGRQIRVVGTGTWQLGVDQGEVGLDEAAGTLSCACQTGVNLVETADVYGDGRSERFVGRFLAEHPGAGLAVVTKTGRRLPPTPESYSRDNLLSWNDRSRENLGVETIDLAQMHSPPSKVIEAPRVWEVLDNMVDEGRIRAYGVSAETCEQALQAIGHPGCASVEIIINVFRHKPLEEVVPAARETGTAVLVRVPLPEGLLSHNRRRSTDGTPPRFDPAAAVDAGRIFTVVPEDVGGAGGPRIRRIVPRAGARARPPGSSRAAVGPRPGGDHMHPARGPQSPPGAIQRPGRRAAPVEPGHARRCDGPL